MESNSSSPGDDPREPAPSSGRTPRGDWTLPLVLLVAAVFVGFVLRTVRPAGFDGPSPPVSSNDRETSWTPAPRVRGQTASLTIDFGNGARREFAALSWRDGMTLGDLLREARAFRPGIRFQQQGAGEAAFLTSLEGVANEGSDGRYWLYSIDGEHGDVSFEVQRIAAGAAALWEFRRPE